MKRIITALLTSALLLTFTACGGGDEKDTTVKNTVKETTLDTENTTDPDKEAVKETDMENTEAEETEADTEEDNNEEIELINGNETIIIGSYEQDGDESNGKEEIEWLVLGKTDSKMLVISKYILDNQQFHSSSSARATWEESNIRGWLNTEFYNTAFDTSEQERIETTAVINEDHPTYDSVKGGNDTEDKIFLLSGSEVNTYFSSEESRIAEQTAFADDDYSITKEWWIRTPGGSQYVFSNGKVLTNMHTAADEKGIRPAMWISLD